jgi:hypothetical protein
MSGKNWGLRQPILTLLRAGALTTLEIAARTQQSPKVIARICACMVREGELKHSGKFKRYRWHLPEDVLPVIAAPPRPACPPLHPPEPPLSPAIGITPEDLAWMQHYRQQAKKRRTRQETASCPLC